MNAFISLATNITGCEGNIEEAMKEIATFCKVKAFSGVYPTGAIGNPDEIYLNAVAEIDFHEDLSSLDARFKGIELSFGRDEAARKRGEVPLDIDIVESDGIILRHKDAGQDYYILGKSIISAVVAK